MYPLGDLRSLAPIPYASPAPSYSQDTGTCPSGRQSPLGQYSSPPAGSDGRAGICTGLEERSADFLETLSAENRDSKLPVYGLVTGLSLNGISALLMSL